MTDTSKMTDQEYQAHMDALAMKVGRALEGERIEHGIVACAACIGFALIQIQADRRAYVRNEMNTLIDSIIRKADGTRDSET